MPGQPTLAEPPTTRSIQRFYDRIARVYHLTSFYEASAQRLALDRLDLAPGLRVLNAGVGTGEAHNQILEAIGREGLAVGLDLSYAMATLSRVATGAPIIQADARSLPLARESFERAYIAYTLDLLPAGDIPTVLSALRRALVPGGRLVAVSMTEGVDRASRLFVSIWKATYRLSPIVCGGCRPLQLSVLAEAAGFTRVAREVVVQYGVPSEILTAEKGAGPNLD